MKLTMWTSTGDHCGIASYTARLMDAMRALGEVEIDVVDVPYADRTPETRARLLAQLNAADVVHLQHEYGFFGGILPGHSTLPAYLDGLRPPHVMTAHTTLTASQLLRIDSEPSAAKRVVKRLLAAWPPWRRSVEAAPFRRARRVIVHTREAAAEFAARGVPAGRLRVLPAGIPETVPPEPPPPPIPPGRWITLFGFVTPNKGYEIVLEALSRLPADVRLVIAGGARVEAEAPYVEALRREIAAQGLSERVTITGFLTEAQIAAVLTRSEVALAPHTVASGSYSVMLPIAYGRPVLASDLACFADLRDADAGVTTVPAGDAGALTERLGALLADEAEREALAAQARAYASRHTWEAVAQQTLALYREALDARREER